MKPVEELRSEGSPQMEHVLVHEADPLLMHFAVHRREFDDALGCLHAHDEVMTRPLGVEVVAERLEEVEPERHMLHVAVEPLAASGLAHRPPQAIDGSFRRNAPLGQLLRIELVHHLRRLWNDDLRLDHRRVITRRSRFPRNRHPRLNRIEMGKIHQMYLPQPPLVAAFM